MTQQAIMAVDGPTRLTRDDLYLFNEGSLVNLHEKLGAHPGRVNGQDGTFFAVWAPDAERVSVIGSFNDWKQDAHYLSPRGSSGIWEGFIPSIGVGALYKYHIRSRFNGYRVNKADPLSFFNEIPPKTASIVWDLAYEWNDAEWMNQRRDRNAFTAPMSIYEMHVGSWRRVAEEGYRSLSYREMALPL
ncbi:MAG: 1,4-alpha-glucan branching enzyme, partial [Nitrospira sp.]